ncbi:MAG TPA: hypothetical protein VFE47_25550 [Tepidisphaeraceae bacterium]|jgi:hypothetical protein|nr:hypothetical protein [Tepidisphaeraceae bacterium]
MITEADRNLLEAYLDDALSAWWVQRLDTRLTEEPLLARELDELKAQRAARIAAFNAIAPSEAEAGEFAGAVLASLDRRRRKTSMIRYVRLAAGVAACLVVGFAVGWAGRGRAVATRQVADTHASPTVPASTPTHVHNDAHLVIHSPKAPEPGQYQVAILDAEGNVVALQHFSKLEDARQFADDLGQFELRRQQVQDSQPMLVSDSF